MTTAARDLSNTDGEPISLYEFSRRTVPTLTDVPLTTYYRYTSADRDITLGEVIYTAIPISDDGVKQSGDSVSDQLSVTMPANLHVPQLFTGNPPDDPIRLVVRRTHNGEADSFVAWAGTVGNAKRLDELKTALVCNTVSASLNRGGLRLSWQRGCPHALYDSQCRAAPTSFSTLGTITAIGAGILTVPAFDALADGWFNGGWVEMLESDGHTVRRGIVSHSGAGVLLLGSTRGFVVDAVVAGIAGCDRSANTCNSKFNNLPNYGGHVYLPGKSPFDGNPAF